MQVKVTFETHFALISFPKVKKQLKKLEVAPSTQMRDLAESAFDKDTLDNLVL